MSDCLLTDDISTKLRAIDAILATVIHDPVLLRSYIQNQEDGHVIFEQLIAVLLHSSRTGLQEQALDVIKILLDPDTMESADTKDAFCGIFYDKHIGLLISAVAAGSSTHVQDAHLGTPSPSIGSLLLIVDLLSYCISQHSYRIKYCILRSNAVEKVLDLMDRPEKALVGAALRLLKTCLMMKDEFYVRYVLQKNIMERVLAIYLKFCRKENMIHSSLLDLLDLLRRDNIRSLLTAVVSSRLWQQAEMVECDQRIFHAIRAQNESNISGQNVEGDQGRSIADEPAVNVNSDVSGEGLRPGTHLKLTPAVDDYRATAAANAMRIKGEIQEDLDEENYFNKLEDDYSDELGDDRRGKYSEVFSREICDNIDNTDLTDTIGNIENIENMHGRVIGRIDDRDGKDGVTQVEDAGNDNDTVPPACQIVLGADGIPLPLPRLVDYDSDEDDDTIPLKASETSSDKKRKPTSKITFNISKIQRKDEDQGAE
jgi:hypothetical protein